VRQIPFRADDELADALERARGLVPRDAFLRDVLRKVPEIARELPATAPDSGPAEVGK
jgi:hypothetical protein